MFLFTQNISRRFSLTYSSLLLLISTLIYQLDISFTCLRLDNKSLALIRITETCETSNLCTWFSAHMRPIWLRVLCKSVSPSFLYFAHARFWFNPIVGQPLKFISYFNVATKSNCEYRCNEEEPTQWTRCNKRLSKRRRNNYFVERVTFAVVSSRAALLLVVMLSFFVPPHLLTFLAILPILSLSLVHNLQSFASACAMYTFGQMWMNLEWANGMRYMATMAARNRFSAEIFYRLTASEDSAKPFF